MVHVWLSNGNFCNFIGQSNTIVNLWLYNTLPSGNMRINLFGTVITCDLASFALRKKVSGVQTLLIKS